MKVWLQRLLCFLFWRLLRLHPLLWSILWSGFLDGMQNDTMPQLRRTLTLSTPPAFLTMTIHQIQQANNSNIWHASRKDYIDVFSTEQHLCDHLQLLHQHWCRSLHLHFLQVSYWDWQLTLLLLLMPMSNPARWAPRLLFKTIILFFLNAKILQQNMIVNGKIRWCSGAAAMSASYELTLTQWCWLLHFR